jgi:hypothetical protein
MQKNVIETPFNGRCVDVIKEGSKTGQYSGKTFEELSARYDSPLALVDNVAYQRLYHIHLQGKCTKPIEITEERFFELLEVLPPCRWSKYGRFEVFHISERLEGNIVTWCAKDQISGKCYELDQMANIQLHDLKAILEA